MNPEVVVSLAEAFSESELQEQVTALARELAEQPYVFTAGSSGGGVSYQRQERMRLEERLVLLRRALEYKRGDVGVVSPVGRAKVIFR